MADERTLEDIEAETARIRDELTQIGDQARENASRIEEAGLTIGDKGRQLYAGDEKSWEAPKVHPVWAPELAYEARIVESMGSATFEYEPTYDLLEEWAQAGKPEIRAEDDSLRGPHRERAERIARMQALTQAAAQRVETPKNDTLQHGWGSS